MLKRFFALALLAAVLAASVFPSDAAIADTGLLISDIPVTYGDEGFRERILERTGGDRDPVGLVLTGGSARALAHIGVLQYLEENGIVPDFIVSNSMGSIIALLYAAGLSPADISELLMAADLSDLFSFTLPLEGGILLPAGFEALVGSVLGKDLRLEDLSIPVMIVCSDLVTKRDIRITEGDFMTVLLASFALPFYFPPQEYRGHILIDGGVVSLLPLEAAYEYTDTVIVSTTFYNASKVNLLNPVTILNTAFDVGKNQNAAETISGYEGFVWIRCNVENFSFMDFGKGALMAELGYESAAAAADELEDIYRSGIPEDLAEARSGVGERIGAAADSLELFGHADAVSPVSSLSVSLDSRQGKSVRQYLNDTFSLAFEYQYRTGGLDLGIRAGGAFDLTTHAVAGAYPLLGGFLGYYPLENLRLSLDFDLTMCHEPWYIPHLYVRQGFDWVILHQMDSYRLTFREAFEVTTGFTGSNAVALSGAFDGNIRLGLFDLWASAGYLMTADSILFRSLNHFGEVSFSARFRIPPAESWFIDAGVFSRFALDGQGNVPLFLSDGYPSTLLGAGSDYTRLSDHHNTIISVSAGYALQEDPTFGEFLIFRDMEIAAYCDMLIHDAAFDFSAGIDFQTAFSVIGLLEMPLRVRLGYDSLANGFVSSFLFTLKYQD